VKGQGVNY
jgi:hypothetical protein